MNIDEVTIDVHDGAIISAALVDACDSADSPNLGAYLTIDGLVEEIRHALNRDAHVLSATFHETIGYPTSVDIDYDERAIDGEMSCRAADFVTLQQRSSGQPHTNSVADLGKEQKRLFSIRVVK